MTANEVSGHYEEYDYNSITDQKALNARAQSAFEERSRQELQGKFKTADPRFVGQDGSLVDMFELRAGSAIMVKIDPEDYAQLSGIPSEEERIIYLMDVADYTLPMARILAKNASVTQLHAPIFHVKSTTVTYGEQAFEIEVEYQNIIVEK